MAKLLIVDDTSEFRTLYRSYLLSENWQTENIHEAESGDLGIEKAKELKPDCILLDYRLGDMEGLEFLEKLKEGRSDVPCAVIVMTGQGNEKIAVQCMKAGSEDYLVKDTIDKKELASTIVNAIGQYQLNSDIREKLIKAEESLEKKTIALQEIMDLIEIEKSKVLKSAFANIETILLPIFHEIKSVLPENKIKLAEHFEECMRDLSPSLAHSLTQGGSKLTPREIQICNLVNKGLSSKEIAEQLDIAIETIAKHRYRIRRKLGLSNKGDRLSVYLHSIDKN